MLAASTVGFVAAKCLRKLDGISILTQLRNFIYRQTAKYRYELERDVLQYEMEQKYANYIASLSMLSYTIENNLLSGEFELSYDSILVQSKKRVAWFPLMQSFYDMNDDDPTDHTKIPEHILVKGIFDLIWNGEIEFADESDYADSDAKYGTPEKVSEYIDSQFSDICDTNDTYKGHNCAHSPTKLPSVVSTPLRLENPFTSPFGSPTLVPRYGIAHIPLKYNFNVGDRVYFFAPNYNLRDPKTGKILIDEEYTPSQIMDARINEQYAEEVSRMEREYGLDYNTTPPIVQYYGVITQNAVDTFEIRTSRRQMPASVFNLRNSYFVSPVTSLCPRTPTATLKAFFAKVRLDFNGKEYVYPIAKLYSAKEFGPENRKRNIWKPLIRKKV